MKLVNINRFMLFVSTGLFACLVVSCGKKESNPIKKYNVKAVPPTTQQSEVQYFEINPFEISMLGANEENFGQFIEGKEGILEIRIKPTDPYYSLKSLPEIINFHNSFSKPSVVPSKNDPQVFNIVWTAPVGTLQQKPSQQLLFKVRAISNRDTVTEKEMSLVVSKSRLVPKIKGISGLTATAEENKIIPFTVDVEDPNYDGISLPQFQKTMPMSSNIEAFTEDASGRIRQNHDVKKANPENLGKNIFRFHLVLDTRNLPDFRDRRGNVDINAAKVMLCSNISVVSVTGVASGTHQICVDSSYMVQPADIVWENSNQKVVTVGQVNVFKFNLVTSNGLSQVAVRNGEQQIKSLSGEKKLECSKNVENTNDLQCTLTWIPKCFEKVSDPKKANLKLTVTSELNKKIKTNNVSTEFEISDSEICTGVARHNSTRGKRK